MPKLTKGINLNPQLLNEVESHFPHRWTHENAKRRYAGHCPACAQYDPVKQGYPEPHMTVKEWHEYHAPLTSDAEWIRNHAFWVHGKRIIGHAEPAYMADQPETAAA
jgi:hypothetical protein